MTTEAKQLQLLLAWMSPAFPIGGFAYSHGLEYAIDGRQVTDAASLQQWIEDVLTRGSGWNDAVIFARCWNDDAEMLNELALALAGSRERNLETTSLGNAFLSAAAMWQEQEELPLPLRERGRGEGFPRGSAATNSSGAEQSHAGLALHLLPSDPQQAADSLACSRARDPSPPCPLSLKGREEL
jgi:urease accessory protein UreF